MRPDMGARAGVDAGRIVRKAAANANDGSVG